MNTIEIDAKDGEEEEEDNSDDEQDDEDDETQEKDSIKINTSNSEINNDQVNQQIITGCCPSTVVSLLH